MIAVFIICCVVSLAVSIAFGPETTGEKAILVFLNGAVFIISGVCIYAWLQGG